MQLYAQPFLLALSAQHFPRPRERARPLFTAKNRRCPCARAPPEAEIMPHVPSQLHDAVRKQMAASSVSWQPPRRRVLPHQYPAHVRRPLVHSGRHRVVQARAKLAPREQAQPLTLCPWTSSDCGQTQHRNHRRRRDHHSEPHCPVHARSHSLHDPS
jgi:hypothetical protein